MGSRVSSLRRDAARALSLSPPQLRLLIEAVLWLGLLRVATSLLPYRRVAALLRLSRSGAAAVPTGRPADPGSARAYRAADAIGWAVQGGAARTPWLSACLVQALAGHVMLRRQGVPSVVYLGVARDAAGDFIAHSWLRCGDRIVTGGGSYQQFSVIAAYRPILGGGPELAP
jgi:Transglutaminase-like superfamily